MRESDLLMRWYRAHARVLPWRVPPGSDGRADPYRVWLSEVMLQQTTVAAVAGYFLRFTSRWPDVAALAAAEDAEVMAAWAGLGYYARARNLLACARVVAGERAGHFPSTEAELRDLPGIGPYTAAAISAIAFGQRAVVVDGNVERVAARLRAVETPLPAAKVELHVIADALTPDKAPGDHAQAMMDLGATICTPRAPDCPRCPLAAGCRARATGAPATYPRRAPKKARPRRDGIVWVVARDDGALLIEDRPPRGLLGGMPGLPCTGLGPAPDDPPVTADWAEGGEVRHVFTHFELVLRLRIARVGNTTQADRGRFVDARDLPKGAFPTVFRKVIDLASLDSRD